MLSRFVELFIVGPIAAGAFWLGVGLAVWAAYRVLFPPEEVERASLSETRPSNTTPTAKKEST